MEENVKTISIPIDEYFDLRQRAEMNAFLCGKLDDYEMRFRDLDRRLFELEDKIAKRG